jgi:enoyl reductase-like protein
MLVTKLINRWEFSRLKQTTKTRTMLRNQIFMVENKEMNAMRYIDYVCEKLPAMWNKKGELIVHADLMQKYYFKFDLPGINYYIRMVRRVNVNTIDRLKHQKENA